MRTRTIGRVGRIGAVVALALLAASCVTGPITGPGGVSLLAPDASRVGYQQSEFFLSGVAHSYTPIAPLTDDGKFTVAANPTTAPFTTRFVVMRPNDPAKFNGTVIVEWINVSAGADIPTDLLMAHNQMVRDGEVWIGVSAQAVGVNSLVANGGPRYSKLSHPGDSYSYDIFTQAGQQIRANASRVLGGLVPKHLIADGESQSASRMVTYIDAIQPLMHAFDGFMVHSRGAGGSRLTQAPLADVPVPSPLPIRDDLDVPVMVVQSEFDVIASELGARQRDTSLFREWEMAGTSHADAYVTSVSVADTGDGAGATKMFDLMLHPIALGCAKPINAGSHHWIFQAAVHSLDRWVQTGIPPAAAPLLVVASTSPVVLAGDALGNALGGIRSPQVDAPVATLTGADNAGAGFCRLYGSTTPLTATQLHTLYSSHADFVSKWVASLYADVLNGFMLPEDASELAAAGQASTIPN